MKSNIWENREQFKLDSLPPAGLQNVLPSNFYPIPNYQCLIHSCNQLKKLVSPMAGIVSNT